MSSKSKQSSGDFQGAIDLAKSAIEIHMTPPPNDYFKHSNLRKKYGICIA